MSEDLARLTDIALSRCEEVLNSNLLGDPAAFLAEAVFVLVMINLKDALEVLAKLGHRVAFTDDVDQGDVTHLVHTFRNAVCHLDSHHRRFQYGQVSFCRVFGRGALGRFGDVVLENPYPDDMAFFYGANRILLRRHIGRATTEARASLRQLAAANGWIMPMDAAANRAPGF